MELVKTKHPDSHSF